MEKKDGRRRVVIESVYPELEGGRYPIKRVVGETVQVSASVFTDGHDLVGVKLMYRHEKQRNWREVNMQTIEADKFQGTFPVVREGLFFYTIMGWVDHASTWHHDILKKIEAKQQVHVELMMGSYHVKNVGKKATGTDKELLAEWQKTLSNPKLYEEAIAIVQSDEFLPLLQKHPDQENATTYGKFLRARVETKKALFSSWYEFFPRSAKQNSTEHGTFKDCEALLPRIANMGFDTVYLPPIHPIGTAHRKGKNNNVTAREDEPGSPWAIGSEEGGHKSINPALGTDADFKALVAAAKEHGLDIALDIAFQCSPDHPYVKENPQWFKWRPDGTVQYAENPPKKYQDVLPLNFETGDWKNLWDELKSVFMHWAERGVRKFRVDNPHTKPFSFWEWVISEVQTKYPDAIFLAEAFTKPNVMQRLGKLGFTQSYTYYTWRNDKLSLQEYMIELTQSEMREYFRPNFWPNTPDINPWELQRPNEAAYMARYFMAATLSSNYGMYGPVYEFIDWEPVPGKEEYTNSEKYEIRAWDWEKTNRMTNLITQVNAIRQNNAALQTTWNIEFCESQNDQFLAYFKWDEIRSNHLLCIVNLDYDHVQEGLVKMPLHQFEGHGNRFLMSDLISGNQYVWQTEWNYVKLEPGKFPFHLFKVDPIE